MKIVKLNRRFKAYREYGHQVGLRFLGWSKKASQFEQAATDLLGSQYSSYDYNRLWRGGFGSASGHTPVRPYWITFRNPAHLTMVMLKVDQKR